MSGIQPLVHGKSFWFHSAGSTGTGHQTDRLVLREHSAHGAEWLRRYQVVDSFPPIHHQFRECPLRVT